ncbi:MAG: tetratricopeptide repeat protein [Pirellulales bacterium]|nr:tetratricopeptide repeat protein [Pirellulales bacterium]
MNRSIWRVLISAVVVFGLAPAGALAEGNEGQEDLDKALQLKVAAENLHDLNEAIRLLESAIEKGLDVENSDFAESMLVESLVERAGQLAAVVQSVPLQKLADPQLQRVRGLAETDLRRVIEYDIAPPQSKLLLAQLESLPGGDPAEAIKLINDMFDDEGVDQLPDKMRAEAHILRATLEQDAEKALADYQAAIDLEPRETEHRLDRAEYYRQQKKLDEAAADADAVIAQRPDAGAAYLLKAQILRDQDKLDDALASADKAAELAPSVPASYQLRGELYRLKDDLPKAIEQFSKVLQLQPGNLLALVHRGEAYLSCKQYDEALADIEAVLKDAPELAVAHGLRAQALASQNRLAEAIAEMQQLADAAPEQLEYRMQLALYQLYNKQPQEAIAAYTKVIEATANGADDTKSQHFLALRGRADAYLNIGDHKSAIADFEEAVKLDPVDSGVLNNFAWVLATSPEDAIRNGKRAIELATKACEVVDYKQAHILSTLAAGYAETGDFQQAREWSQKAVDLYASQRSQHEAEDGKEQAEKVAQELAAELESYKADKPWRERQTAEQPETAPAPAQPNEPTPPATAETPAKPGGI